MGNPFHTITYWEERRRECAAFREERLRAIGLEFARSMLRWMRSGGSAPDAADLLPLIRSKRRRIRDWGCVGLRVLSERTRRRPTPAERLFPTLSIESRSTVLRAFGPYRAERATPLHRRLLALAVDDESPSIRKEAVCLAYFWLRSGFIKFAERVQRVETDPDVLASAEEYLNLRRQGYHATFMPMSWSWSVEFPAEGGIANASIPKHVVDLIGIEAAVGHVKRWFTRGPGFVPWDEVVEGA